MTDKIDELNQQLNRLNRERNELIKEKEKQKIEDFRKLEWTSLYDVYLYISESVCAGLPTYRISIPGLSNMFYTSSVLFIFGDEKLQYEYNISYRDHDYGTNHPSLTTSCPNRLIEFLEKVNFKSISYNNKTLSVLLAAQSANNRRK